MALRLVYLAAGAAVGFVLGTGVLVMRAEDLDGVHAETIDAANEAQVQLVSLLGAMSSTRLSGRSYLLMTGELQPPLPRPTLGPPLGSAIARADCLIQKESGGLDVANRSGSPARGPGQYFPSTWVRHSELYRQITGYVGPLSLHSLLDVRAVMSTVLGANPGLRREWAVSGCA